MNARIPVRAHAVFSTEGIRPTQEDQVFASPDKGVFIVADGFGGMPGGNDAAKAVCDSVKNYLHKEAGDRDATMPFVLRSYFSLAGNVLFNSILFANQKLMRLNRGKSVHEKGGASVIAGYLDGDLLALASVGSCSAWLLRRGQAVELVVPRTYAKLYDPFSEVPREQFQIPLTALGMGEDVEPEIFEYKVRPGDWLWFQSDGMPPGLVQRLGKLQVESDPSQAVTDQVRALLEEGQYSDNSSISLVIF